MCAFIVSGSVSAKLDAMLLKAAKTVVKPVDADALKATTASLPKSTRKAIDKAAAKALNDKGCVVNCSQMTNHNLYW